MTAFREELLNFEVILNYYSQETYSLFNDNEETKRPESGASFSSEDVDSSGTSLEHVDENGESSDGGNNSEDDSLDMMAQIKAAQRKEKKSAM